MTNLKTAVALLAGVLAAACSKAQPANPHAGQVKFSSNTQAHVDLASGGPPAVCGTFVLQPVSIDSAGHETPAGSPVSLTSVAASQTDAILGCIDDGNTTGAANWGYLVTATNFVTCGTGTAIPGLSPAVAFANATVDCKAGKDVSLAVTVDVSIPLANDAGYIDVGVGVNVNTPPSGCKIADLDASGMLHFGQSYVQTTGGPTPAAYTGIGLFTPPSGTGVPAGAGTVQQFVGSVNAHGQTDAFFTGLLQMPAAPQAVTLVQAFAQPCPGQMTIQPHAVECQTSATLPGTTSTAVQIADVFADWPGRASVSATVSGAGTILLQTSLAGPHLGTLTPAVTGYDALTHTQTLSVAPANAIGVYGSLVHSDELLALVQDPTLGASLEVLTLDEASGQWSAAAPTSLASSTLTQLQAMGIFGAGGCFTEPLPACIPGPQAAACTATANAIPVPVPQGATVVPTNAGCVPGTTYQPGFYYEFEPGAPTADASGNGRSLAGFNGNGFPSITSGPTGGYLSSNPSTYEFFFIQAGPTPAATHGGTLEMLVRFGPDGAIGSPGPPRYGFTQLMGLGSDVWGGKDGVDTMRFVLYSYGSVGFAATIGVIDASADGSQTRYGAMNFDFPMDGFNGRSWSSLTDGQFHHFAISTDFDRSQISLSIDGKVEDGWTQPLPTALSITGLDHHQEFEKVGAGVFSWGFNGEGFRGDLDEVAWTPAALPQTILAQHAAEGAADQHYSFIDQCPTPPPVPPSTDTRAVSFDFAPTVDGSEPPVDPWTAYLASGGTTLATAVPKQLVSEQLLSFPLPRYLPGHALPRMDSWLDPTYFAWLPEFEGHSAGVGAERGAAIAEMTRNWNFHTYVQTSSTPSPWEIVAQEGGHSLVYKTFLVQSEVDVSGTPSATYSGRYTRAAAAAFSGAGAVKGHALLASIPPALLAGPPALVVQDVLLVEDGETIGFGSYSYGWLTGSPDFAFFQSTYDSGGACSTAPSSSTCSLEVATYQAQTIDYLRQAYYAGFASALPPATFPSVRFTWYNLDGTGVAGSSWGLGGRSAAETQPGQTFQPPGFVQHLSGSDEYIVTPDHWSIVGRSGNDDIPWLDQSRPVEEAAGDFLMAPFISAGWSDNAAGDVRPPQMLSLVKYMVAAGAISFHPGVFPTSLPAPAGVRLSFGRYPDGPGDARESIWQAAVASYGQALASHVESRMRSSRIVWETDETGGTHIFHQAGDPGKLAAVRQQFDASNAPLQRFVVSASLEGFANGVGAQSRRSENISFKLTQGGSTVTLPARRQGSFYSLDLDGPAPVLVQYDAWHEDGAFNYWQHGFSFEAEANDGVQAGAGGLQLAPATEAPGLASLDFTNFTSFLTVQPASTQSWTLAQAAQAPRAAYQFEPRSAWETGTWYVWVRARNHGAAAAPVYVSVDGQAAMELGCIAGAEWQWVQTDIVSGQPAALAGLTLDQPHTLWVAPGSGTIDIDQVKLVAEASHMECPLAATCGCGQ